MHLDMLQSSVLRQASYYRDLQDLLKAQQTFSLLLKFVW